MGRLAGILSHEFRLVLPPTLFFLVCFNLLVLTVEMMTDRPISEASHLTAVVAALVAGKAVLIADKLPFMNRYPDKPLIWNTVWKAALYVLVTLAFRLAERLVAAATSEQGFAAAMAAQAELFDWPRFWIVQLWLALLFVLYAATRELAAALGGGVLRELFLMRPPRPGPAEARSGGL